MALSFYWAPSLWPCHPQCWKDTLSCHHKQKVIAHHSQTCRSILVDMLWICHLRTCKELALFQDFSFTCLELERSQLCCILWTVKSWALTRLVLRNYISKGPQYSSLWCKSYNFRKLLKPTSTFCSDHWPNRDTTLDFIFNACIQHQGKKPVLINTWGM